MRKGIQEGTNMHASAVIIWDDSVIPDLASIPFSVRHLIENAIQLAVGQPHGCAVCGRCYRCGNNEFDENSRCTYCGNPSASPYSLKGDAYPKNPRKFVVVEAAFSELPELLKLKGQTVHQAVVDAKRKMELGHQVLCPVCRRCWHCGRTQQLVWAPEDARAAEIWHKKQKKKAPPSIRQMNAPAVAYCGGCLGDGLVEDHPYLSPWAQAYRPGEYMHISSPYAQGVS
jgi:hypothetical protein